MLFSSKTTNLITKAYAGLARPHAPRPLCPTVSLPPVQYATLAPHLPGYDRGHERGRTQSTAPADLSTNPYCVVRPELGDLTGDICAALSAPSRPALQEVGCYYFDGEGKMIRPLITSLVAMAVNCHLGYSSRLLHSQRCVAQVSEMIHTASLLHDDVLDRADTRRGKASVVKRYGPRKSVSGGNFIQARATSLLAKLNCPEVLVILAKVTRELVTGEFMQLSASADPETRFQHYIDKSAKKTASLIAHSCEAVALLGGGDAELQTLCFQYGRSLGVAFQLVDDMLDFVALADEMGKPTAVDLTLGVATAPVLYAAEQFPELEVLIARRFTEDGDVRTATECVRRSAGLARTRALAGRHCQAASDSVARLKPSRPRDALLEMTELVLARKR